MNKVKNFVTDRRTDGRMSFNVPRFRERRGTKRCVCETVIKDFGQGYDVIDIGVINAYLLYAYCIQRRYKRLLLWRVYIVFSFYLYFVASVSH